MRMLPWTSKHSSSTKIDLVCDAENASPRFSAMSSSALTKLTSVCQGRFLSVSISVTVLLATSSIACKSRRSLLVSTHAWIHFCLSTPDCTKMLSRRLFHNVMQNVCNASKDLTIKKEKIHMATCSDVSLESQALLTSPKNTVMAPDPNLLAIDFVMISLHFGRQAVHVATSLLYIWNVCKTGIFSSIRLLPRKLYQNKAHLFSSLISHPHYLSLIIWIYAWLFAVSTRLPSLSKEMWKFSFSLFVPKIFLFLLVSHLLSNKDDQSRERGGDGEAIAMGYRAAPITIFLSSAGHSPRYWRHHGRLWRENLGNCLDHCYTC